MSYTLGGDDGGIRTGSPMSYTDNADGTITDNNTGLMWEKKVARDYQPAPTDDLSTRHDADNCYPWSGTCQNGDARCSVDADCGTNGVCEAGGDCQVNAPGGLTIFQWMAQLNAGHGFAGHTDWRIPNIRELQSIVDWGVIRPNIVRPSVNTAFNGAGCDATCTDLKDPACGCTVSADYWSSTSVAQMPSRALLIYFFNGYVGDADKVQRLHVRAVRGGI